MTTSPLDISRIRSSKSAKSPRPELKGQGQRRARCRLARRRDGLGGETLRATTFPRGDVAMDKLTRFQTTTNARSKVPLTMSVSAPPAAILTDAVGTYEEPTMSTTV